MSTALEDMADQLTAVIEDGPFTTSFTLDPTGAAVIFKGVYDIGTVDNGKDSGGAGRYSRSPRILVSSIPAGAARRVAVTDGTSTWAISSIDPVDTATGVGVIWLV